MAPAAQAPMSSSMKLGAENIPDRWQKLQGSESWDGLLHPLDADLRASLIAYGELAEATYDGFNDNVNSPDAGQCIYSPADLLAASGVSHPEYYAVKRFLYATCDKRPWRALPSSSSVTEALFVQPAATTEMRAGLSWKQTNWIGYVAVATDDGAKALGRRDIVVAWRGTDKAVEISKDLAIWYASAATVLGPYSLHFKDAKVHHGFLSVYTAEPSLENQQASQSQNEMALIVTSARDQALAEVRTLMEAHKDEVTSITVAGHSLGASLATLNAIDMVAHRVNVPPAPSKQEACPVTAILFASPMTGNDEFKRAFASFPKLRALGVINKNDIVPKLPPYWYMDTTTATLHIDTTRSPYLRPDSLKKYHNLECYLHGVAGDCGDDSEFKLVVDRDLALVNKFTDALKEGYPVPAEWWVTNTNKGTIKGAVGRCKLNIFKAK